MLTFVIRILMLMLFNFLTGIICNSPGERPNMSINVVGNEVLYNTVVEYVLHHLLKIVVSIKLFIYKN